MPTSLDFVLQACRIVVFATLFLSAASVLRRPSSWQLPASATPATQDSGSVRESICVHLRSSVVTSGLVAASEAALGSSVVDCHGPGLLTSAVNCWDAGILQAFSVYLHLGDETPPRAGTGSP